MVNKNKFYSTALASIFLILFLIFAPSTVSASLIKNIEIRGPVYNGSDIDDIIDTYGDGTTLRIDATQFSALYYDIDKNLATETLSIKDVYGTEGNVIGEGGLVYRTNIQATNYGFEDWGMYPVIFLFTEKYIPLNFDKADKLTKLVLDSDDEYSIRTGEILDLGEGYAIEVKQVDVNGSKVWLEFTRNGEYVDDEIISVVDNGSNTWDVELDGIQGEYDVVVLKVHINQIFQDAAGRIAQIQGIWLIDYANTRTIDSNDEFGTLNDVSINGDTLVIANGDTFTLTRNDTEEIAGGLAFKTADSRSSVLRFYVMKEITEPDTYEIRGQIASGTGNFAWDATNFAGFYYNFNDNVFTESLAVSGMSENAIPEGGLVYSTTIKNVDYEYSNTFAGWDQYPVLGFFGEQYIPINPNRADKFAKLVLDSDDKYTLGTGETLDLGQGYAIEVKQIDVSGGNVLLEFTKDGELVDDELISIGTGISAEDTWDVELDGIQSENGVVVLRAHVNQVFQGEVDSIAQIEGLWLIDYANATTIEPEDDFGSLNNVSILGDVLTLSNEGIFTLTRGDKVEIGQGMFFKIANTSISELRYYPFVEKTIEENNSILLPVADFSTNVTSGYAPLAVQFTDLSQNAASISWDVNNDGIEDSSASSFVYEYASAGTYTAKLTAASANGTNEKTTTITVEGTPTNDSVEVRGPVYEGSDIDAVIDAYGDGSTLRIDATQFSAFYYDIDNNVATETLSIRDVYGTQGNVIGEGGIVYQTTVQATNYMFKDWGMYPVIGFFGENYIPLNPGRADKFCKLVLDSNDMYNIKTGETLDLGEGYAIEVKQIDINGSKVWLEFTQDGVYIDDEIISVAANGSNTWEVELDDIQDEDDVVVFRVHINQIFQGAAGRVAQIEGLWLIDYTNATIIESDDEFGVLNDVSLNGDTLVIRNADPFTLIRNSNQKIASGLYFKIADTASNVLRFYVFEHNSGPGTYEIRGRVVSGTGDFTWNATNFAGFYYDLNNDVATESLSISGMSGNVIPVGGLVYSTIIEAVNYEYPNAAAGWDQYPVLGFFGEQYIPINPTRADKFAKLVLDSDDKYTLGTGETLDLGQGYAIEVKQIDVNGSKVWLEFTRGGEFVDDEIISVVSGSANTWESKLDGIQGENDVVTLRVHVNQVFEGENGNISQIEGLWLIDYANATAIESDDEFGKLNDVRINGDTLTIRNENIFTMTRGNEVEIGQGIFFKIANTSISELRYYPFVEKTIEANNSILLPVADFSTSATSGYAPLSVVFTDLSQNATSISWDVNGDGIKDSSASSFVYEYASAGTYTAKLTAINANGTNEKTTTITVGRTPINDSIEVRGPVYEGSDIDAVIDTYGDGTTLSIDATQFAAFYYDIDNNIATETLSMIDVAGTEGNVIGEGGIVYQTTIQKVPYEYENMIAGWDTYPVLGFFGEQYIPINPYKAEKFAELILDSDDKYTLGTGEILDLGQGYAIEVKQIDIDGSKVWLEFTQDGEYIDNEIISVSSGSDNTWEVQLDGIQSENGVVVFRVHINQLFQGEVDSIAQIEGLWLIDYTNATSIESDDEFGVLNDVSLNGDTLVIRNADPFTLIRNSNQEIASGLYFKVADTASNVLRFYVMKELTEPGIYEIRGQVASGTGDYRWDATNFAGFYYDLNDNVISESLSVYNIYANMIEEGSLVYSTTIQNVDYEYLNTAAGWDQYPVLGFFGEQYIPINPYRADKLAKLVLDSDDKYSIKTGEILDLGKGYAIEVKQIDISGSKVWLEFTQDGEYVDDEILSVISGSDNTWEVELDGIQGEDNVVVFRVHINQLFQDAAGRIAQIQGIWLIDYANAITIDSNDEFGTLNDVSIYGDTLVITNEDTFTLTRGDEVEIGQGMYFKVADTPSSELRYYPFVENVVGEHSSKILPLVNFNSNVTSGNAPLAVQFTDTSQYATGWQWDFENDGTVDSSVQNPVHVYTAAGTYTVSLTASNVNGTASKTAKITVSDQSKPIVPVANFTANTTQGYAPLSVRFTDTSQYATGISWDFNNDGLADASSGTIVYVYTASGQYKVNLTASNANGTNSKSMTITVYDPSKPVLPIADFTANSTSGYAPLAVQFTDLSQNTVSWSWDFEGDGISDSGLQNPAHVYKAPGIYTVNLSAGNQNGTASKTAVITVLEKEDENETKILPVANFSTNVTSGPAPLSVLFNDLSQNSTSRNWDVNNDGIRDSDEANFVYEFTDPGNYTVNLTAINTNGTDSKSAVITVLQKNESKVLPVANFSTNVTGGRVPLAVQFIDLSQNATSISWDVNGDGIEDSNASSFVYEYTSRGIYTAKLTAKNANGTDEKTTIMYLEYTDPCIPPNSGGGGGGGGSSEPAKNVEVKEISQVFIANGKHIQFDFTRNATCVVYVGFDAKKTVGKTTAIAEQLKNKSTLTSNLTDGEVYRYFNVWVGNSGFASSENIENPVICFKVLKSWVQDNNIDKNSIALNRYSNKTWEQLPVSQLREDSKYLYFTADVPGYTFFAITGEKISEKDIIMIQPESQKQSQDEKTGSKTGIISSDMEQKPEPEKTASTPGFLMIYGIASLFVLYRFRRK